MSSHDSVGIKTVTLHLQQAGFPAYSIDMAAGNYQPQKVALRKNFKQQPAIIRFAHFARTRGLASWVMQWFLFSAGFPTGAGSGYRFSSNPTNWLPTSLLGQATRPPGGSTAHLQLFKSSTSYVLVQPALRLVFRTESRLVENINRAALAQPLSAVERCRLLWETHVLRTLKSGPDLSVRSRKTALPAQPAVAP